MIRGSRREIFEEWSATRDAQGGLPVLIRKLIYASTEQANRIEFPGIERHGWDGVVNAQTKSFFVPDGVSGWEISVEQQPGGKTGKAERDFKARKSGPLGLPPSEVTFIFITSRKWDGKQKWRDEKRRLGKWKGVEAYDSSDLEAWLEVAPGVDAWLAERLGRRPPGVISIVDHWDSLSRLCEPRLKPAVFLAAREKVAEKLKTFLLGTPGVMPIECRSPIERWISLRRIWKPSKPPPLKNTLWMRMSVFEFKAEQSSFEIGHNGTVSLKQPAR